MDIDNGLIGGAAPGAGATDLIKDTTTDTFMADVIEASKEVPVLVDFWAPWCGPCRNLTPVLENVVNAAKGAVKLVKMNIDDHPQVAGQLGVQSIPAVFAFKDGRPVDGFMGALPESQVKSFIERILGDAAPGAEQEKILDDGDALLAAGSLDEAAGAYATVLREDDSNTRAIAGIAKVLVEKGELDGARQTLAVAPPELAEDPAIKSAAAAIALAEKAGETGELDGLRNAVDAAPDDLQARFDYALALNGAGERDAAAKELIEIVRRDREWNEDGARVQLLEFFEVWGAKDPATQNGRRMLASVLFA